MLRLFFLLFLSSCSSQPKLVEIDGGRKMYLECQGTGSPTVVFISGRSDRSDSWGSVFTEVSKMTHACAYDRPGTFTVIDQSIVKPSRSDSVSQPTTPMNGVADLHALLSKAEVSPPYLLVGHSFGGLIARLYAKTYPDSVLGIVLVDPLSEFFYDELKPQDQPLWIRLNSNYSKEVDAYIVQEKTDLLKSFNEMRGSIHQIPMIVLASDKPFDFQALKEEGVLAQDAPDELGPVIFSAHLKGLQRMTEAYHGKLISDTHSGHYIQKENPDIVIESIREMIEFIRSKTKSMVINWNL